MSVDVKLNFWNQFRSEVSIATGFQVLESIQLLIRYRDKLYALRSE